MRFVRAWIMAWSLRGVVLGGAAGAGSGATVPERVMACHHLRQWKAP